MSRAAKEKTKKKVNNFIRLVIPSELCEVENVCRGVRGMLTEHGLDDNAFAVDLLLREFVNNAILHGNCLDCAKMVEVSARIGRKWITLSVTDEGPGFCWRALRCHFPKPSDTSGRGLTIGSLYADRIIFNKAGNRVMLMLKKQGKLKEETLYE
ncbi:MAG: ATP-binding protein [Pseudomonadota bacterium]|nr:ATP-binding protein [Pseudomonadota bacterium]